MADDTSVPLWWIAVFIALTLAVAAGAVLFVGGDLVDASGFVLPV